jgi:hypothetical protein
LLITLRPNPYHRLALAIEIALRVGEFFNDDIDTMPELRTGEILIHLSIGVQI